MTTLDEITAELHAHGRDAESAALTMIRCLDYDSALVLDAEAYRAKVRMILDAAERAVELHIADLAAGYNPRRRALGIPTHGDDDHEWRADGYCNCGAERKTKQRQKVLPTSGRTAGVSNLDVIEQNWSEYR